MGRLIAAWIRYSDLSPDGFECNLRLYFSAARTQKSRPETGRLEFEIMSVIEKPGVRIV
jgi:hypothetical protein